MLNPLLASHVITGSTREMALRFLLRIAFCAKKLNKAFEHIFLDLVCVIDLVIGKSMQITINILLAYAMPFF